MEKEVLILGAGLSGRGMLGELLYNEGFDLTFVDIDAELVNGIKEQGYYHVIKKNITSGQKSITKVEGFSVYNVRTQRSKVIELLLGHDIIFTALKPDGFDEAIDYLAEAIKKRKRLNIFRRMYIFLGANYVGLYEYYDKHIRCLLDKDELEFYERYVVLVMSIINRKNLKPIEEEDKLDAFAITGDDKPWLRVEDLDALREIEPLPTFFKPEKDLSAAMAVKIWSGNVVQCSMAFVALHKGLKDTREAAFDKDASRLAYEAAKEAYYGVYNEYGLPLIDMEEKAEKAVKLFRSKSFSDDLYRIAREPIRKFSYNDRFIGPARLCMKYGKLPYFITKCLAYGFLLDMEGEKDISIIKETIETQGIRAAIISFCGLSEEIKDERLIIDLIEDAWRDIKA